MKVIYHEKYKAVYSDDPASAQGRIECIVNELGSSYQFVKPIEASNNDIRLVHTEEHIAYVKRLETVYNIAKLAVGGTLRAAELAMKTEPSFALIRPPGHHASSDSCWGFCYFNNVAIAIQKLRKENRINDAVILDFDLHFGDGTSNIFNHVFEVAYYHAPRTDTVKSIKDYLTNIGKRGIIAVSAGFDRHELDWGGMLKTEDYRKIGEIVKHYAEKNTEGRYFAALEGGYNHKVLGINVKAFLEGMQRS
nr:histone deacetylase family protein [Candidatus Njordarchaeota archaeon]